MSRQGNPANGTGGAPEAATLAERELLAVFLQPGLHSEAAIDLLKGGGPLLSQVTVGFPVQPI